MPQLGDKKGLTEELATFLHGCSLVFIESKAFRIEELSEARPAHATNAPKAEASSIEQEALAREHRIRRWNAGHADRGRGKPPASTRPDRTCGRTEIWKSWKEARR